jgi:hypothetical protein
MFRLLCLCQEDLGAKIIVIAYNEQTCMFIVHVLHHALWLGEGLIAKHTPVLPFRAFKRILCFLLVRADALSTGSLHLVVIFNAVV